MLALSLADNDLKRTSALHDEVATSTKITADSGGGNGFGAWHDARLG